MMESIEKLREWAREVTNSSPDENIVSPEFVAKACGRKALLIADAIEAEIAERYMELPVDADGEPIHVSDKMQYHGCEPFTVCAVAPAVIHTWAAVKLGERKTTYDYNPAQCTHYKPRTLEDVLQSAGVSVAAIEDVAAEIRELLSGDAE